MAAKLAWFERKFSFDFPVAWYPDFIERLRGAPVRAEEHVRRAFAALSTGRMPSDALTRRQDDSGWSIIENIGHLADLEVVWQLRLDDYLRGDAELSPADLTNRRTHDANYNVRPIDDVLREFRSAREGFVSRLESLRDEDFARTAIHPRLKQPMRLVDGIYFSACHDDYHLARVAELMRHWSGSNRS